MNFEPKQISFLESKGLTLAAIEEQIARYKKGTQFIDLVRPARLIDGIRRINTDEQKKYQAIYDNNIDTLKVAKFIPASGAATRMFKALYEYLEFGKTSEFVEIFIKNIQNFAFFPKLKLKLKDSGFEIDTLLKQNDYQTIIRFLLKKEGLTYGELPKGLLDFHPYKSQSATPIEEHVKEAISYAGQNAELVFTISEEFKTQFEAEVQLALKRHNATHFTSKLTYQKPKTDTIAVYPDLKPVCPKPNEFMLRPGGHGSLIENLNDVDSDIIFIKNIDNVSSEQYLAQTSQWKKILAGVLLELQSKIFKYLEFLETYDGTSEKTNFELREFMEQELGIFARKFCGMSPEDKLKFIKSKLNRPIRICGMVKNEGEPGGGPFWVRDIDQTVSLQIVESSQINIKDENQELIFSQSTHFNPVDLVCSVRTHSKSKFDLNEFVDKSAYFIAEKSYQGQTILALEHPGLWNGGMANWNTVFIEVPMITFNPVKTINDLLRKEHQN